MNSAVDRDSFSLALLSLGKRSLSGAILVVVATVGTIACDAGNEVAPQPTKGGSTPPPSTPATSTYTIQLSHGSIYLVTPPGEPRSVVVTATVRTNTGDVVSQAAVVWTTDSPGVATVTETGSVTAVGAGTTLLRARFGGSEANALVTVTAPTMFTVTGNMSVTRLFHTATLLNDGKVLIVGGSDGGAGVRASAEVYDPVRGTFTRTGDMTRARVFHSATLLPNGKVLITGGIVGTEIIGTAELYDPATGTFSQAGDLRRAQHGHAATLLTTGKVLISGGRSGWSGCCPIAANAELYDPATGVFTTTGTYAGVELAQETPGLVGINATLLRDGRVLLTAEPAAQVYDPVAGTFSRTGAMLTGAGVFGTPQYISGQTATLLEDGKVLLTGGHHEDIGRFKTAELYDPSAGAFVRTGDMDFVRDGHAATLLTNGTVLITGGEGVAGCAVLSLANSELYEPSKGAFVSAGNMNVRREWHTATRLKDGRVLVTGGTTFDGGLCGNGFSAVPLASAELYVLRN